MYKNFFKRILDFILALLGLIILSPVFLVLAILIRTKLGSPVIFKQKRPGKNENIFTLYKFRSMSDARDSDGNLLPDNERLTSFGKKLRSTSLDELPEMFNILMGSMSIVGPRPQLIIDVPFMNNKQRKRHNVRPGLTGLAQVSGRNGLKWEDRLAYDNKYVEKITFINDLKIFFKTVVKVFTKEGISEEGMDTSMNLGEYLLKSKKIDMNEYRRKLVEKKYFCN